MNGTLLTEKSLQRCIPVAQQNCVIKHARFLILYTTFLVLCLILLPAILNAQLRELEITPDSAPATVPVFVDYLDEAAVIINSSIPNLQFNSTLEVIQDLSQPGSGRYVIIIPAARQSIQVSANGFITQSFSVGNINAREVRYFRVEPKNVNITETGTLMIQTNPSGATITIDGVPGTYTSPNTFSPLLAQGYTIRISLPDYEDEVIQVGVNPDRPSIQSIDLVATFGFLNIQTPDGTLFLRDENTENEYRRTYTVGEPLKLGVGSYNYRLTREDFSDATGSFVITPNGSTTIRPQLLATFGFLKVLTSDVTLFVTPIGGGSETRLPNRVDQQHRLSIGRYQYRATRNFHLESDGVFEITSNQITTISPSVLPAYGTLRVNANVRNFTLSAVDNNAPNNPAPNEIFLERGRRTVVVSAPGYVDYELEVSLQAGEQIERSVILESIAQRDERLQREGLPAGILEIATDVDAEIFVDGIMRGRKNVVLTLTPGQYMVELRHPVRKQSFLIDVPTADIVERYVELLPVRSRALTYSVILPGVGHTYRKETRGYLYMGLFIGSAFYTYTAFSKYDNDLSTYNDAQNAYRNAGSTQAAIDLRTNLLAQHRQATNSRDALILAAGVVAGVYALQLLDVAITRPRYGYRGSGSERSLSFDGGNGRTNAETQKSLRLSARMDGVGFAIRGSF
jgi:hypothetical protein